MPPPINRARPTNIRQRSRLCWLAASTGILLTLVLGTTIVLADGGPPSASTSGRGAQGTVRGAPGSALGGCTPPYDDCDDNNACTYDYCDFEYQCHHDPINCGDDGLLCTIDSCDPTIGCIYTPVTCDSDSACIRTACSEETGTCVMVSKVYCGDRNACTEDWCDFELGCVHAPIRCDDRDACTADACDPTVGCVHRAGTCDPRSGHGAGPGAGTSPPTVTPSPAGTTTAFTPLAAERSTARADGARRSESPRAGEGFGIAPTARSIASDDEAWALAELLRAGGPIDLATASALALAWQVEHAAAAADVSPMEEPIAPALLVTPSEVRPTNPDAIPQGSRRPRL